MKKIKNFLIKKLGGLVKETTKTPDFNQITPVHSGLDDSYLFDFKNYGADRGLGLSLGFASFTSTDPNSSTESASPKKIKIKPIEVLGELEKVVTPFSLNNLDEKIEVLKDKEKLITQFYAKREIVALIERLENRKKYVENKVFFDNFQNTTDEHIETLLEKYELVMKISDIFVPEFPDEAVQVMKEYTEKIGELFGKKPVFYVIAEENLFRKAWDKRDPILLVQSPFGFFWQILGAWDKEMMLLSEL